MGTERVPYLLGHAEIAQLYGVRPQTPQGWRKRGILDDPDVVISGNPYWLLPTVLALKKVGRREVTKPLIEAYNATIPGGYSASQSEELPPIVEMAEVAWIFGKTYATINQWRNRRNLAQPNLLVSGSPLWLLETVLADAEHRGRSVSDEAVERIRRGHREGPKPRGPQRTTTSASAEELPLPPPRDFGSTDAADAVIFIEQVLDAGHLVRVEPLRDSQLDGAARPPADGESAAGSP